MVREDIRAFRDNDGSNLLHYSCGARRHRISKILLDLKIFDVNEKNERGYTAIHLAAESDTDRCIKSLLMHGADLAATDHKGNSVVHLICKKNSLKCLNVIYNVTQLKISQVVVESETVSLLPSVYNAYNKSRKSALHYAAEFVDATCLGTLLDLKDINIELVDNKSRTPLHIAANKGSVQGGKLE
jgi:ankyrin repeat protein